MIIYYLNYDGINCSVFDSQIYTYCHLLSENEMKIRLINCDTNILSKEYIDKMKLYSNSNNLKVIALKKNKKHDFLIDKKLINELITIIKSENHIHEKVIIHCRGIFSSFIGLKVRKKLESCYSIKVISDFRGAVIDEYLMRYKDKGIIYQVLYNIVFKILIVRINSIQAYVCKNSDGMLCVSKKLEEYLKDKYIINCHVSIIPTCIDATKSGFDLKQRIKIRNEMNLENKFIVTYCGGGQSYQKPEESIIAFIKISERIKNSFFLILTKDKKMFEITLSKLKVNKANYLIISVPHNEVYRYLSACDLSILLRDNNNVNKVASPTKFAEYISCNLPVFTSHNIGDIDEINARYNVCIYEEDIYDINEEMEKIKKHKENFKLLVDDYYQWNKSIDAINFIYNKL